MVASLIRRIYQILLTTLSSQSYKAVKVLHWRWRSSGLSVCGRAAQSVVKHVFTYVIVGAHNTIVSCSDRWTQKISFVFPLGRAMRANRRNRNTYGAFRIHNAFVKKNWMHYKHWICALRKRAETVSGLPGRTKCVRRLW